MKIDICRILLRLLCAGLALWSPSTLPSDSDAGEYRWVIEDGDGTPRVQLWFFWSSGCPHCREARPWVRELAAQTPWLVLHDLELSGYPAHAQQYVDMAAALGQEARYVPAFLFCGRMLVGWGDADSTGARLAQALAQCRESRAMDGPVSIDGNGGNRISLPLVGDVDGGALSLPVLTLVVAGLDAFNPCAFFVLLFLLSLLVHLRDRRRMLLIGGLYVLVSGIMYYAFMAAWLNVFLVVGSMPWVTAAAGLLAVVLGAVNVKDFFAFRRGVSLSMTDTRRADVFRRGRRILAAGSLPAMIGATLLLAVAANLYELLCTAGLPMVYTRLLTLQVDDVSGHYLWLALYNVIYVLPLLFIVLVFVRTMGGRQLSERQGRLLKLLSGLMMTGLGGVLLAAPELLDNPGIALALPATALVATWIAARASRERRL